MKDSQSHASNNFKMNIINRAKLKNGNLNRAVEYAFYEVNSAVTYLTYKELTSSRISHRNFVKFKS